MIDAQPSTALSGRDVAWTLLRAPVELRSYANLAYLLLAFPLGLAYFLFLTVGLSLGFGLTIIWVGLPILLLVLLGSRGFTAVERQLAIHLLGAEVPPMSPMHAPEVAPRSAWQRLGDLVRNPVTWKGLAFQYVKFPLGLASFVLTITTLAMSLALLLTPFYYSWEPPEILGWEPSNLGEALLCSLAGVVFAWLSLNLWNGVAWVWKMLASASLGSESFAPPSRGIGPVETAAVPC